jgi:hypothetical protein
VTRLSTRLAGALAVPLVLAGCGAVSSAASGLEQDAAAANAALAGAEGVGVVLRFDDPDGDLERALQEGPGALPAELAEVVVGSRVELRVAATGGRTLADQPEPGAPLAEQLRWADSALTVSTADADLLSWRTVDGVLYVASDLAEVERVAAASGSPLSLRDEVAGAPAPVLEVHDALRAGQAVAVPFADLLEGLGALAGTGEQSAPERLPDGLLDDLRAAVEPHARLTDLGSDDGVRRVTVEVDLQRMLEAVSRAAGGSLPEADDLTFGSLGDGTVTGTLTIEDGHYRRLDLPLGELADLAPAADVPDLGDSALVVELDDEVRSIEVPTRVAELDLLELLGSDAGPSGPADEALLACFEQAETEEQLEACAEPA